MNSLPLSENGLGAGKDEFFEGLFASLVYLRHSISKHGKYHVKP
jgi:hypothetical protein